MVIVVVKFEISSENAIWICVGVIWWILRFIEFSDMLVPIKYLVIYIFLAFFQGWPVKLSHYKIPFRFLLQAWPTSSAVSKSASEQRVTRSLKVAINVPRAITIGVHWIYVITAHLVDPLSRDFSFARSKFILEQHSILDHYRPTEAQLQYQNCL